MFADDWLTPVPDWQSPTSDESGNADIDSYPSDGEISEHPSNSEDDDSHDSESDKECNRHDSV